MKQDNHSTPPKDAIAGSVLEGLKKVDKKVYLDSTVQSFMESPVINTYKDFVFIDRKPGLLSFISLIYDNKINIEIEVSSYVGMNPFDANRKWQLDLFKKEKIGQIRLLQSDKTIEVVK